MFASIELFEALKTRFGDQEAKIIVKVIEKIETGIDLKVDKKFEESKNSLATKEDLANLKVEMQKGFKDTIKWMFIFVMGLLASLSGIMLAILHAYLK